MLTILDFDGRHGRALNMEGFTNFQKPLAYDVLMKAVGEGKVIAIDPAGQERLNQDIIKAVETEFDGHDKLAAAAIEIRKFRRVLVQRGERIEEYLIKATPAKEEAGDQLEKGDEYYALNGGIATQDGKPLPLLKTGEEIRTALMAMMQKLQAENTVLFTKMADCVTAVGFGPMDAPYDAADRALGNRYAWEVCRQYDPVEGALPVEGQPANHCRAYNDYFNCYCSNMRNIKLCGAYIANLKDNKEYQLNSGLYTLLFQ